MIRGPSVRLLLLVGISAAAASRLYAAAAPVQPAAASGALSPEHRAVITRYCLTCHNQRARTGGLALDAVLSDDVAAKAEIWEKVIRKLEAQTMPPVGAPRPEPAVYEGLRSWLASTLDQHAATHPTPGRTATIRRLTREEYRNVVRDLLTLDVDVAALLPADSVSLGFDNMADFLSVSPALLERYLAAARKLSRLAVGVHPRPTTDTLLVPLSSRPKRNEERADLPIGTVGGVSFHHLFPADGEYSIKITLHKSKEHYVRGVGDPHQLHLRLDDVLVKRFDFPGAPGQAAPRSVAGTGIVGSPEWEAYTVRADEDLQVTFAAQGGPRTVSVAFVGAAYEPDGELQPESGIGGSDELLHGQPTVESVAITGPFNVSGVSDTPSRRAVFICHPTRDSEEFPCAQKTLAALARRAYRRPVTANDVKTLMDFYLSARAEGTFEDGIQFGLERILAAPDFLFRVERDPIDVPAGGAYLVSELALASRLSFFLWSSVPDEELLDLAVKGRLRAPGVLDTQGRRMLADPRSKALVTNFGSQWLELRNLRSKNPNSGLFPAFDDDLRDAFERETLLFLESQIREDRSVLDLLRADYTYLNERLARHYGIPGVSGPAFRQVTLANGERGGLLGHASLLTVMSYPNRTSPVLRGKWVLEVLLGTPPPPPPPNVPSLPDRGAGGQPASVRERLEHHRDNPVCASCHASMDPLGFALEHFDPVGRWRATDAGSPVDATGSYPGSPPFKGLPGLRDFLLARKHQYIGALTEKLMAFGLGRPLQYYDMPAVRGVVRDAVAGDSRWTSLLLSIVKSTPFQQRVTLPVAESRTPADVAAR